MKLTGCEKIYILSREKDVYTPWVLAEIRSAVGKLNCRPKLYEKLIVEDNNGNS